MVTCGRIAKKHVEAGFNLDQIDSWAMRKFAQKSELDRLEFSEHSPQVNPVKNRP